MSDVSCVASWFGSNRMLASEVGQRLKGCNWVGVPFAGGLSEVFAMDARTINVNDKHRHVMNLATCLAHHTIGPQVYRQLRRIPFHPEYLATAQRVCLEFAGRPSIGMSHDDAGQWAVAYFVSAWMTRHGSAGTDAEFKAGISTRWNASGGDSAAHYQGAVRAINTLRRTLRRCNFTCLDFREFLAKCKDEPGHGLYADAPFFGPGEKYTHKFTKQDHVDLRDLLLNFTHAMVVIRYYDVEFVRELYPSNTWDYQTLKGRKQTNEDASEVLITRIPF